MRIYKNLAKSAHNVYTKTVDFEFDPAKDADNVEKHGVSLERAADLVPLAFVEDDRSTSPDTAFMVLSTMCLTASPRRIAKARFGR